MNRRKAKNDAAPHARPCGFSPPWLRSFRARLLTWFRRAKRDLPWRGTRDAYRVWVSEIMLQQTQVAAVVPYYERFVAALPSLADLAAADEQEVLRLWEGLGYYRRARQLHAAARLCVERHDGQPPRDYHSLRALPGIGRYTAGAVLSIAHDQRLPILEANTVRLLSRLLAFRGDPHGAAGQKLLWQAAEELLPARDGAGEFNQALMELGAVVCAPNAPRCDECPAAALCPTRAAGAQGEIPRPKRPKVFEEVREAAVVVRRRGRVLVVRREGGRWGGLWDFPRFPLLAERGAARRRALADGVELLTGAKTLPGREIAVLKHGVTRFRITLVCYEAECAKSSPAARHGAANGNGAAAHECRWVRPAELEQLPMSVTGRKLARLVGGKPIPHG